MSARLLLQSTDAQELYQRIHQSGHSRPLGQKIADAWANAGFRTALKMRLDAAKQWPTGPDPDFVMGFWRSGTTFLHELLALDPQFAYTPTALCMNPAVDMRQISQGQAVARPMDGMLITAHGPQEDEFALLAAGAPSFYRSFVAPEGWKTDLALLRAAGFTTQQTHSWNTSFDHIRRLAWATAAPTARTLLLKSPNHSFKLKHLSTRHPDSRKVLILRDFQACLHSTLKLWKAMFGLYARQPWQTLDLAAISIASYQEYCASICQELAGVNPQHFAVIAYEDLAKNPIPTLTALYSRLGWQLSASVIERWQGELHSRHDFRADQIDALSAIGKRFSAEVGSDHAQLQDALMPFRVIAAA